MNVKIVISKKKNIVLVTSTLLVIFVSAFLWMRYHQSLVLPQSILQLRLTEEVRGVQAHDIMAALHKKLVTPDENVIGTYFSTDGRAKLYVSFYDSRTIAEEQFEKMISLIRSEGGAFSYFREFQVQDEKVHLCVGYGQAHYFFLHNTKLYWWSVDLQIAQATMQELVRFVDKNTR